MKVLQVKLSGSPTCGDEVLIHATHPTEGGKSSGGYTVREGDTLANIAKGLYESCIHPYNFSRHFGFKLKNDIIIVICDNKTEGLLFIPEVIGAGTETLTVEEL